MYDLHWAEIERRYYPSREKELSEHLEGANTPLMRAASSSGKIRPCLGVDGHQ